jgi:hypothetical protein
VGANDTCRSGETALGWSQNGEGDITGVTAGTGLTGGGTSGAVTVAVAVPLSLSEPVVGALISGVNTTGVGVHGQGEFAGVTGSSEVSNGMGVDGQATKNAGPGGIGVRGFSQQGDGVVGQGGGTTGAAIHGKSGGKYAGLFDADVKVDNGRLQVTNNSVVEAIVATNTGGSKAGDFDDDVRIGGNLAVASCTGCTTAPSDRNLKDNLGAVDSRQTLERLLAVPVERWGYKSDDPAVRHIGPMAQDFAAAFGVGSEPLFQLDDPAERAVPQVQFP